MRFSSLILAVVALLAPNFSSVCHASTDVAESPRPAARIQALDHADQKAVKQFLVSLLDRSQEDEFFWVGSYRVVDLDGDGVPELIVALDFSGRAFFNTLRVVWAEGPGFRVQDLPAWNLGSLAGIVSDLNSDGKMELILPQELTPYLGSRPMATWRAVYTLDSNLRYRKRSERFKEFYDTHELPRIAAEIDRNTTNAGLQSRSAMSDRLLVLQIERDKIHRILGDDPEAGLATALECSTSGDPTRRLLAVGVLADIGNPRAREALKVLARDAIRDVAVQAASALTAGSEDPD
jgi:hypothetical protein